MFAEGMRGFSVIEVLIVSVVVLFVSAFALVQIARARDISIRNNAARELTAYLEKARLDSIRRHATVTAEMAQVTILNSSYYTITIDSDGDGTLDNPRVINLPADSNLRLNGPFPRSILFNWRGRTADLSGTPTTPSAITIRNGYGVTTIDISQAGQTAMDVTPQTDPISNSTAPPATFRDQTRLP